MQIKDMSLNQYEKHYSEIAPNYPYLDDFSKNGPHWHRTEFFTQYLFNGIKIWDVGCSNGGLAKYITEKYNCIYFASDIAPFFVQNAQINAPRAICGSFPLEKSPFVNDCFDLIIVGEVLEHVIDINIAMNELKKALKTGGWLLITTPRYPDNNEQHLRYFDQETWQRFLPNCLITDNPNSWMVAWNKKK